MLANPFIHLKSLDWSSLRDAAFSNQSGIFHRPFASLSFAINYYAADGFVSFPFKLTNLVIHGLNGCLVFLLSRLICARLREDGTAGKAHASAEIIPFIVTAFWLLHPLQLTSVLYVVQRMNSLSALFTLLGLVLFMYGRERLERNLDGGLGIMLAGVVGGVVLGVLCKENATLLPVYALVLELGCFSRSALDRAQRLRVRLFFAAVLGLPVLGALAYTVVNPDFILASYQSRTFSLEERLLTQPRVLFYYVGLALFPSTNALGLYHDDFVKSTSLLEPVTTVIAIAGWILLVVLAIFFRRRVPVLFLGLGWFLGGQLMESSVFALELVHEHRNYLPIYGILFSLTYALLFLFKRINIDTRITAAAVVLTALTLGFVTNSRAYSWSSKEQLLESLIKHHPKAPRSHGYYAEEIINNKGDIRKAYYHLQQYSRLKPDAIVGLAEMIRIAKGMRMVDIPRETLPAGAAEQSSVFEIPLVNHPDQLKEIAHKANAELERRLKQYPVSGNTVKTLVDLQACLYRGTRVCVAMAPEFIRWMELALENSKMGRLFRAVLLMTTAKTYSWLGAVDKAVEYAELSVQTLPKDVNLSIDLVKLHLALGNYDRGIQIIEGIKRRKKLVGYRGEEIRELEARLNAEYLQSAPGT
ncbi:MAG: hypothetical protein OER43_03425 [Gammaproteobacteria bacterium]|nr:hypothetical protein [Gammaproteobacteria bacterium]